MKRVPSFCVSFKDMLSISRFFTFTWNNNNNNNNNNSNKKISDKKKRKEKRNRSAHALCRNILSIRSHYCIQSIDQINLPITWPEMGEHNSYMYTLQVATPIRKHNGGMLFMWEHAELKIISYILFPFQMATCYAHGCYVHPFQVIWWTSWFGLLSVNALVCFLTPS